MNEGGGRVSGATKVHQRLRIGICDTVFLECDMPINGATSLLRSRVGKVDDKRLKERIQLRRIGVDAELM